MFRCSQTWTPELRCETDVCSVKPTSKYVPIRKKQKYNAKIIGEKIRRMISIWNENNPFKATEGFEFDFDEVANEEKKRDGY